jgi:hypothetical protein
MAILVNPPSPLTPEQEARVRQLAQAEIATWYATAIPNALDRDGKPYSRHQADLRGVYGYDISRDGGLLEKRSDALETSMRAVQQALLDNGVSDDALEAAMADMTARLAEVRAALAKPILP